MKTIELTTTQYAAKRKITSRAVTKAIKDGTRLPGVKSYKRVHQYYLLTVNIKELENFMSTENQLVI